MRPQELESRRTLAERCDARKLPDLSLECDLKQSRRETHSLARSSRGTKVGERRLDVIARDSVVEDGGMILRLVGQNAPNYHPVGACQSTRAVREEGCEAGPVIRERGGSRMKEDARGGKLCRK